MRVVAGSVPKIADDERLLVYLNHPGWWDPLVGVVLTGEFFKPRQFFAPIDAEAVEKYAVMKKLGFFPVEQQSVGGLRSFLESMQALMNRTDTAVMVTPHGQFVDVRNHQPFQPGLGHVVAGLQNVTVLPLAIEYTFWDESTPELLVQFGDPVRVRNGQPQRSKQDWTTTFETALQQTQANLKSHAVARDASVFETIIGGQTGAGGVYDFARRIKSWFTGRQFDASHSQPESSVKGRS